MQEAIATLQDGNQKSQALLQEQLAALSLDKVRTDYSQNTQPRHCPV
jgi:hypothetical protein